MAKQTPPVFSPTKRKPWSNGSVEALAPLLTLDQAHELLQALTRTGHLILSSDDEEEALPLGPTRHAA